MARNRTGNFLICYDIADPRRLQRVHRRVSRRALPIQYSVYLFHGTVPTLERLLHELQGLIVPTEDDIRAYPVPEGAEPHLAGRNTADRGLFLLGTALAGFSGASENHTERDGILLDPHAKAD